MPAKTFKMVEIVGISDESIQQAVRNALEKAAETLRNIDWFEVTGIRGYVKANRHPEFQVQVKVGFRLLDRDVLHGSSDNATLGGARAKAQRVKRTKSRKAAAAKKSKKKK